MSFVTLTTHNEFSPSTAFCDLGLSNATVKQSDLTSRGSCGIWMRMCVVSSPSSKVSIPDISTYGDRVFKQLALHGTRTFPKSISIIISCGFN